MLVNKNVLAIISAVGIVLTASTAVYATQSPVSDNISFSLRVPHLRSGYTIGVAGLGLIPGASNLNYAIYNKALPLLQPSWTEQELDPGMSPAFELDFRYVPKNSGGKDFHAEWLYLNSRTTTAYIAAANSSDFVGPDYDIGPDGSNIRNATGLARFRANVIHLDAGQHISFGRHLDVRLFGGLNTGFLKENLTDTYAGTAAAVAASGKIPATSAGPFSVTQYEASRFSGAGPRLGVNANYHMHCGFGFLGEGAASLLMGTMDSNTNYLGTSQTLIDQGYTVPNPQYIADQHVFQVIPAVDAKLGIDYKYAFNSGTDLILSTGYQAAVYIHAISQYLPGTLVLTKGLSTGSVYVVSMNHIISNYSVQGPFLKLSLQF